MSAPVNQGATAPRRGTNPPPVCFNCNEEGHFVVNCPKPSRLNNSTFPVPPVQQQQHPSQVPQGYYPSTSFHQGPYQNQPQYPSQSPYQQFSTSSQPTYGHGPGVHSYSAPPTVGPYGQTGFHPPPYNQYPPQNGYPQYGATGYPTSSPGYSQPINQGYNQPQAPYPLNNNGHFHSHVAHHAPGPPHQSQWTQPMQPPQSALPHQRQQRNMSLGSYSVPSAFSGVPTQSPEVGSNVPNPVFGAGHPTHNAPSRSSSTGVTGHDPLHTVNARQNRSYSVNNTVDQGLKYDRQEGKRVLEDNTVFSSQSPDPQSEEDLFLWDFDKIFMEPPKLEFVALAQPLATSFEVTPVPKIDTKSNRSVSRLARNDNQKEFIITIRHAPYWSFAQEDPVFADLKLDFPLIPIDEVPAWISKRQGIPATAEHGDMNDVSLKRSRSVNGTDLPGVLESDGLEDERSSKRQKNEYDDDSNDAIPKSLQHHGDLIPILDRSSTPCVGVVDDAWAPQPGEAGLVSSPADPAEALLASLGVTGKAKPVKEECSSGSAALTPHNQSSASDMRNGRTSNNSNFEGSTSYQEKPTEKQTETMSVPPLPRDQHETRFSNDQQHSHNYESQQRVPWSKGMSNKTPVDEKAPSARGPDFSHSQPPYVQKPPFQHPQQNKSYGDNSQGLPYDCNVPQASQHYGPGNGSYQNGQIPDQTSYANGKSQYAYPQPQYGYAQFQSPVTQRSPDWNHAPVEHNSALRDAPPYTNHPHAVYSGVLSNNVNHGHVQRQSSGETHSNYSPNGARAVFVSKSSSKPVHPNRSSPTAAGKRSEPDWNERNAQPYHSSTNEIPSRQDSGYLSARGSYSNGSGKPNSNVSPDTGVTAYDPDVKIKEDQTSAVETSYQKGQAEGDVPSDTDSDSGSPLSPTSAEILGKLEGKSNQKPASWRHSGDRKTRRPQPVVAEAYSRRW